ncbi:unnamed protein product [Lactuca virosa]|uniref:Replication factor A C-terminal domain-containing protein n=1 Tax=Lactuca virosa TaxID=75947 RepID=A0AAU9PC03_9ASTR|nr:unnamed protein product [Lactuca virosa]
MILMDEEGTKYHSRVFNQNFSRFGHLLKEDETYIILKPNMAAVINGFSYTSHKQTLTLDWKSILKKCEDFSGPVNGFMFVDFNSIIEQTCPRDTFFDVIGQIVSFRPLETSNPVASKHYIKLTLSNLELKADDNGGNSEKSITSLQSYSSSYTDDFKGTFPLKTICEITEPLKTESTMVLRSMLQMWKKKINPVPRPNHSYTDPHKITETVVVQCKDPRCNKSDFHTVIKYIIPINVQDGTGTIGLTLFDREAKRLLDISAYELKKIHEVAGDSDALFPMQLNVLKNRKFGFLVDITKYNVDNYNNIYTILKLTEDVSILSELESKLELMFFKLKTFFCYLVVVDIDIIHQDLCKIF